MTDFTIRPLERSDREWVAHFLDSRWSTTQIVSRGKAVYGHLLPGFVAERASGDDAEPERIGVLTYNLVDKECEISTIDSLDEGKGIASALIDTIKAFAKESGWKRIWLITTNDNLKALQFYQKRDFVLVAVHRDAIAQSRRIKPQIPIVGQNGIPIRDEIELEWTL